MGIIGFKNELTWKQPAMPNNHYFKIIQITDTHLFGDESKMFGVDCNKNFLQVVEKVRQNEKDIDFIFATGDLSQDETIRSYQIFRDRLNEFQIPVYWIPGNHDNLDKMEEVFKGSCYFFHINQLTKHQWNFIFVNTKVNGRDSGFISGTEIDKLKNLLSESRVNHQSVVIVMHHHPIVVNTPLIDHFILENRNELLMEIEKYDNVKVIICGHVHGDYTIQHNRLMLETAPATCLQWEKGTKDLKLDPRIGYKIYEFSGLSYSAKGVLW